MWCWSWVGLWHWLGRSLLEVAALSIWPSQCWSNCFWKRWMMRESLPQLKIAQLYLELLFDWHQRTPFLKVTYIQLSLVVPCGFRVGKSGGGGKRCQEIIASSLCSPFTCMAMNPTKGKLNSIATRLECHCEKIPLVVMDPKVQGSLQERIWLWLPV